jgi:hypothetical protein
VVLADAMAASASVAIRTKTTWTNEYLKNRKHHLSRNPGYINRMRHGVLRFTVYEFQVNTRKLYMDGYRQYQIRPPVP